MASDKQTRARIRNWLKARIIGMCVGMTHSIITEDEREIIKEIVKLKDELLDNWDRNSAKLGMYVKPKEDGFTEFSDEHLS